MSMKGGASPVKPGLVGDLGGLCRLYYLAWRFLYMYILLDDHGTLYFEGNGVIRVACFLRSNNYPVYTWWHGGVVPPGLVYGVFFIPYISFFSLFV